MNQLAGFTVLLFAALLFIISSVTNVKVIAQGDDNSSEKSTTAAKTCSPEVFKGNPGLYATCVALAHNKESARSNLVFELHCVKIRMTQNHDLTIDGCIEKS